MVNTFLKILFGKMWKSIEKSAVFPDGYGRIDCTGGYDRRGGYRVKTNKGDEK